MNRLQITILTLCAMASAATAQEAPQNPWTLRECIDYALENNIQIKLKDLNRESVETSLEQSRAALYPTLSFSSGGTAMFQNARTYNDYNESSSGASLSGNLGLSSGMTLYQGGKLRKTIESNELAAEAAGLDVEQQRMDIEISVAQAYLQMLYNHENLGICLQQEELDSLQVDRAPDAAVDAQHRAGRAGIRTRGGHRQGVGAS